MNSRMDDWIVRYIEKETISTLKELLDSICRGRLEILKEGSKEGGRSP